MVKFPAEGSVMAPWPESLGYCPTQSGSICFQEWLIIYHIISLVAKMYGSSIQEVEVGMAPLTEEIFASHPYILDSVG